MQQASDHTCPLALAAGSRGGHVHVGQATYSPALQAGPAVQPLAQRQPFWECRTSSFDMDLPGLDMLLQAPLPSATCCIAPSAPASQRLGQRESIARLGSQADGWEDIALEELLQETVGSCVASAGSTPCDELTGDASATGAGRAHMPLAPNPTTMSSSSGIDSWTLQQAGRPAAAAAAHSSQQQWQQHVPPPQQQCQHQQQAAPGWWQPAAWQLAQPAAGPSGPNAQATSAFAGSAPLAHCALDDAAARFDCSAAAAAGAPAHTPTSSAASPALPSVLSCTSGEMALLPADSSHTGHRERATSEPLRSMRSSFESSMQQQGSVDSASQPLDYHSGAGVLLVGGSGFQQAYTHLQQQQQQQHYHPCQQHPQPLQYEQLLQHQQPPSHPQLAQPLQYQQQHPQQQPQLLPEQQSVHPQLVLLQQLQQQQQQQQLNAAGTSLRAAQLERVQQLHVQVAEAGNTMNGRQLHEQLTLALQRQAHAGASALSLGTARSGSGHVRTRHGRVFRARRAAPLDGVSRPSAPAALQQHQQVSIPLAQRRHGVSMSKPAVIILQPGALASFVQQWQQRQGPQ